MSAKLVFVFTLMLLSNALSEETSNSTTTETDSPVQAESELPAEVDAPSEVPVTSPESGDQRPASGRPAVAPLDIHGLDNKQPVFHQKHQVPDGSIVGTYGYYDSRNRYHVLNYVHDLYGIRILSDYLPFDPISGPPPPPGPRPPPPRGPRPPQPPPPHHEQDTEESDDGRRGPAEPLAESDGDNLLRDEHSVIRTTVVPPPYGDFRFYQGGNDVAGTQSVPFGLNRRNGTQYYYFHQGFQNQRGRQRIPYPYENALYPLLYQDPKGNHGNDDDINDTSGLDTSDGVSEVPSKPIRHHRPIQQHLSAPSVGRPHYDAGYYNRHQYQHQGSGYYQQYAQPQHNYIVPQSGHYQAPVRPQVYYPQQQYYHPQQQQQSYYYQPVVSQGYNRYEPYQYGYNH